MKLAGIAGKGRGRLGSMVYKSVNGEQIVSQYQPSVSNPNTTAQVNQRARFKLMSQVAAAVSGEIAIPKSGLTSSRNAFVKKNFALSSINEDAASINLEQLQFTAGNVAVPPVVAARGDGGIIVALSAAADVSRVCYLVYRTNAQQQLQFVSSTIAETAGADGTFPATLAAAEGELIVYAYGMRDTDAAASARYGNYNVQDGTALASLIVARTLSTADYSFTRTVSQTIQDSPMLATVRFGEGWTPEKTVVNGQSGLFPSCVDDSLFYITLYNPDGFPSDGYSLNISNSIPEQRSLPIEEVDYEEGSKFVTITSIIENSEAGWNESYTLPGTTLTVSVNGKTYKLTTFE